MFERHTAILKTTLLLMVFSIPRPSFAQQPAAADAPLESAPVESPEPPRLPKVDAHACPFECCTFRTWTVNRTVVLWNDWQSLRKQVATLQKGEKVEGVDGVHVVFGPDIGKVSREMPELGLKPGNEVFRYMYLGEGSAQFWFKGKYYASLMLAVTGDGSMQSGECSGECDAMLVKRGKKEWWVKVKTASGKLGWALADYNFDGMDACG